MVSDITHFIVNHEMFWTWISWTPMKISGPSKQLLVVIYLSICINLGFLHTVAYFISSEGIILTASKGQSRYSQQQHQVSLLPSLHSSKHKQRWKECNCPQSRILHNPALTAAATEHCVDAPWENKKFLRMLFTNAQCYTVSMFHDLQCTSASLQSAVAT